jgi:hypothetical protein
VLAVVLTRLSAGRSLRRALVALEEGGFAGVEAGLACKGLKIFGSDEMNLKEIGCCSVRKERRLKLGVGKLIWMGDCANLESTRSRSTRRCMQVKQMMFSEY